MADHGIVDDESGEHPDAKGGKAAADEVDTRSAEASHTAHFLENGQGVPFSEMMERQAAKNEVGTLVAKRELAGVGLDKEHLLTRRSGAPGDLEGLELDVDGHNGDIVAAGLGMVEDIAAMIAITGRKIDQNEAFRLVGKLVEDGLNRFSAAKSAIEAGEILQVAAQGGFVLIGQIHQLGLGFGEFTLHPCENAHS